MPIQAVTTPNQAVMPHRGRVSCFVDVYIFSTNCLVTRLNMELLPPPELLNEYTSDTQLMQKINEHAARQGYAVMRGRSKDSKKGVLMKIWIHCDRQGEPESKSSEYRATTSKRAKCPFKCIAKLQDNAVDEHGLGI